MDEFEARLAAAYRAWHESRGRTPDRFFSLYADTIELQSILDASLGDAMRGSFVGKPAAIAYFAAIAEQWEMVEARLDEVVARGEKVVCIGHATWRNLKTLRQVSGPKVDVWTVRDGLAVHGYGVGDLVAYVDDVSDAEIDALVAEYEDTYRIADDLRQGGARHDSVREAARIEVGLRGFLEEGGFSAFTTTFEDLHGLTQLPGLAVQRLMVDGYGFGAEGDWKTSALLRAMKVMSAGFEAGTSLWKTTLTICIPTA
jgi:L-arabinose isomerase